MSKSNKTSSECKICGDSASFSHYGVIACQSCKMFFKRNAENRKETLKCHFDGQCEVNINNRHVCAACRLEKCFKVGMCIAMIRCPQSRNKRKNTTSSALVPVRSRQNEQSIKLPTLNLLDQDRSLLTTDQWNLLSNLIHSYDEHNALTFAKNFVNEINSLHPKLRFKIDSAKTVEISKILCQTAEPFIQSNHHFASLPLHNRSIILRGTVYNISCLGASLTVRESGLIESSAYRHGLEITYGTIPYNLSLNMILSLDQDFDLVKLSLSIFAFCTSGCILYDENTSPIRLTDIQSFLSIQNMYAEIVWKYLLYKYSFEQSVIRFSHLVYSMIAVVTITSHLQTVKNHTDVIDTLIENIEHGQMNIDDN
ncbi:unnamed protein product [Rotaria sordida]|nr:unnamed protein product [Rotaria sordida]CAF3847156.1 unnamed protein product [Rotaria sordida]CAF4002313.1 unnamed protein product [Rotaria sordida]